jgi:hypothetical protein
MMTRQELAYAAWYLILFTMVVGWAALRPAVDAAAPAAPVSQSRVGAQLDVIQHEPEMRRVTQRMVR